MKCPLMFGGSMVVISQGKSTNINCLKERCAWWNVLMVECSVYTLAFEASTLRRDIQEIKQKMSYKKEM